MTLSKIEVLFAEVTQASDFSHKMEKDLKVSFNEVREGWKKARDDIQETRLENLDLFKAYMRSTEDNYFIM